MSDKTKYRQTLEESETAYSKFWRSLERVAGIEPAYSAWKAAALPLSYTRGGGFDPCRMVEEVGFEPT